MKKQTCFRCFLSPVVWDGYTQVVTASVNVAGMADSIMPDAAGSAVGAVTGRD